MLDWVDKYKRMPEAADADSAGCEMVWHRMQHLMIMNWAEARRNQFVEAWAKMPEGPEWEKKKEDKEI